APGCKFVPSFLILDLVARGVQSSATASKDGRTRRGKVNMKLTICRAIGRAVVARGSADCDAEGGGILACRIKRHHGLLSPLILRSSPTDRDHRWIVCRDRKSTRLNSSH